MTSLGMPAPPPPTDPTWKTAWDTALYGPSGWLRSHPPACSFEVSEVLSVLPAADEIVLLGAAGGMATDLAATSRVRFDLPAGFTGLVVACDWLSHVPAHVVEVSADGFPTLLHVSPETGRESFGARLNETVVPRSIGLWLERWWPVADHGRGARAEVGTTRDAAWQSVVRRLGPRGRALAFEPSHLLGSRPVNGALTSSTGELRPDGSCDLTAAVALDSVAAATHGEVHQADVLTWVESRV